MCRWINLFVVLVLGLAACTHDSPLGPADGPPELPHLLIGQSPLMTLHIDPNDPSAAMIEVTTEVTRGLTLPKPTDVFLLRIRLSFKGSAGGDLGFVGPQDFAVSQVKDETLRGEDSPFVEIGACIDIPAPLLEALKAADGDDGTANPTGAATVELVLVDGDGKEHILDTKSATGVTLDANNDG